jgi:hypothetical protein
LEVMPQATQAAKNTAQEILIHSLTYMSPVSHD